jgi:hypothetical protein
MAKLWASIVSGFITLCNSLVEMYRDATLRQDGANKAKLEGMEKDEKLSADIAAARADAELRKHTRDKYTKR